MADPTYETHVVATEDLTLSAVVWQRFRRPMIGMLERIYALNLGLSEKGAILPIGTKVVIPIDPPAARVTTRSVIQLWD